MKKLMVMAAVIGMGFAAQATMYVYFSCADMVEGNLYTPNSDPMIGSASLFAKESNTDNNYAKVGGTVYFNDEGCTSQEAWLVNAGLDASKTYDFYYVVEGDIDWVYTSGVASGTTASYGEFSPDFTAGTWTKVVPEPTSGMLMLLGLAGLALKRKRA